MLLQDQSDGAEDILQDKIPAAEATQTNCPPQNSSVQHSKGVHRAGRTNLEGQGARWVGFFFLQVGWIFALFFQSVSYFKKNTLCNPQKGSKEAVSEGVTYLKLNTQRGTGDGLSHFILRPKNSSHFFGFL